MSSQLLPRQIQETRKIRIDLLLQASCFFYLFPSVEYYHCAYGWNRTLITASLASAAVEEVVTTITKISMHIRLFF